MQSILLGVAICLVVLYISMSYHSSTARNKRVIVQNIDSTRSVQTETWLSYLTLESSKLKDFYGLKAKGINNINTNNNNINNNNNNNNINNNKSEDETRKGCLIGLFAVADAIKPEAKNVIDILQNKQNIQVWMVTGDNTRTARAIAEQAGITNVFAEVLPADKANKVKELRAQGHVVAMIGDGINDSPALAEADVGIAIGSGTDVAIEAADMVLMKSNLRDVVIALDISRKTFSRIKLNFVWAYGYNVLAIPLAMEVLYPAIKMMIPPWVAGLAMALSSVSVVMSSLALRFYTKPKFE